MKGKIPRMISAPLLSQKMAAHLYGGDDCLHWSQVLKSSISQGRSVKSQCLKHCKQKACCDIYIYFFLIKDEKGKRGTVINIY